MELGVCLLTVSFLGNECCIKNVSKKKKKAAMPTAAAHHTQLPVYARELEGLSRQG